MFMAPALARVRARSERALLPVVFTGNARTRCRWRLRFQLSRLTLLLRSTNRSGPPRLPSADTRDSYLYRVDTAGEPSKQITYAFTRLNVKSLRG